MNTIDAISTHAANAPLLRSERSEQGFHAILRSAASEDGPEAAREAAEQFIAVSLVQPVLAQMRETNNAAPPFAPTQAERHFGARLDARIAEDLVRASNFPIVDRLARDLQRGMGSAGTAG